MVRNIACRIVNLDRQEIARRAAVRRRLSAQEHDTDRGPIGPVASRRAGRGQVALNAVNIGAWIGGQGSALLWRGGRGGSFVRRDRRGLRIDLSRWRLALE